MSADLNLVGYGAAALIAIAGGALFVAAKISIGSPREKIGATRSPDGQALAELQVHEPAPSESERLARSIDRLEQAVSRLTPVEPRILDEGGL